MTKYCKDCVYADKTPKEWMCTHPSAARDLVTGAVSLMGCCSNQRKNTTGKQWSCGEDGAGHEPMMYEDLPTEATPRRPMRSRFHFDSAIPHVVWIDGHPVHEMVISAFTQPTPEGEGFRIVEASPGGAITVQTVKAPA
jgi:hypothetical protein